MKSKTLLSVCLLLPLFAACTSLPDDIQDLPSQYAVYDDSVRVHYKSWGDGPETMVFVHGFGCDMNAWEEQFDAFKQEKSLRLVFVDMPGYGESDKPHVDYTLDYLRGGVWAVMDTLHVNFASFVGHSLGTPVCRHMLIDNPARVGGICDVDGVYCFYPRLGGNPSPEEQAAAAQYEQAVQDFAALFDGDSCRSHIEGFVESLSGPNTPASIKEYAMQTMPNTPEYVASSTMHHLIDRCWWHTFPMPFPAEIICTQNSGLEPDNREKMKRLYSVMEYTELTTCGHFIQMEQPAVVNGRINALREKIRKNNLEDFDFGIHEIECNYAGFPYKVTDAKRAEYEQIKKEYRDSIAAGVMYGPYGLSEICCYLQDFHLGCAYKLWSNRFPMKWAHYGRKMQKYDPQPVSKKLNEQTYLLRFPTWDGDEAYMQWVRDAVEEYRRSGCTQLIIDIRGNGGGSDYQYMPVAELLYLQPGTTDGIMMRNTQENRDRTREAVNGDPFWTGLMDSCEAKSSEEYVELFAAGEYSQEQIDARRPSKTAVIIDHAVGSSGEQFVLDLRAVAPDVKFYGKENTLGCIDVSNVRPVRLPHAPNSMFIPVTISYRVVDGRGMIDGIGIEPDVRIDLDLPDSLTDNVDPWIPWVEQQM